MLLIVKECFTSSESKHDFVHKHSGTSALHKKASTILILISKLPLIHFHIYLSHFNKSSQNKLTNHLNFSENNAATKKSIQIRGQMTRPSQKTRDSAVVTLLSFCQETYSIKSSHCCALRKTEGRPVVRTSEIHGAQHSISTKKSLKFFCLPGVKYQHQGILGTARSQP